MRLRDGPRHRDADRDRHTLGHSHAVGHSHSPQGLHGHLSALTLNLLLTRSGGGMAGRRANSDSRSDGERSNGGQTSEEELRISLSLGLSVSLALGDPGGEGVKAESTDQRSNSSGGGGQNGRADRRANSVGPNTIKSSNTRGNTRGNTSNKAGVNNSSGGNTSNSHGGKLGSGDKGLVGDHLALDSHLGLELGADLGDDVPALLGEAGLGHGLGLSSALLGLCALLLKSEREHQNLNYEDYFVFFLTWVVHCCSVMVLGTSWHWVSVVHTASSLQTSSVTVSQTCSGTCFTMLVHCCSLLVAHCCSGTSLFTVEHSCTCIMYHVSCF